jgi:transcriptional regulator with XRE-family HTH domain
VKLSDAQVAEVRALNAGGVGRAEIAARFGVSVQHVGRLVLGRSRPTTSNLAAGLIADRDVTRAVERFVEGLELDAEQRVLAEAALALAAKLDQCRASPSAAAAQAAPAVARQLIEVVAQLRERQPQPDNPLTQIRRRLDAQLSAMQAGADWKAVQ